MEVRENENRAVAAERTKNPVVVRNEAEGGAASGSGQAYGPRLSLAGRFTETVTRNGACSKKAVDDPG